MADSSKIEWTEATWNPVTGCTKVSPGCDHCYAERITERFHGKGSFTLVRRNEEKLYLPLRWRKPRRIFVNSMSDLFHDDVPLGFLARAFAVMAQTPQHTYQLLTKRHGRMRSVLTSQVFVEMVRGMVGEVAWPLPNVWLGVSVENQQWADIRIPALIDTPAAVRWLSCEPLLGPIDLYCCGSVSAIAPDWAGGPGGGTGAPHPLVDWVVVGGESGPGARPMHPAWVRQLRDDCGHEEVPFFFKQWGEWSPVAQGDEVSAPFRIVPEYGHEMDGPFTRGWAMRRVGKKAAGRLLDGELHDAYPAVTYGS